MGSRKNATQYSRLSVEEKDAETRFEISDGSEDDSLYEYGAVRSENGSPKGDRSSDDSETTYTVEDAVEAIGMGWFQLRIYLTCSIISATDALEMMLLAVLSPVVRCEWFLTDSQVAFVTTVVFIGMGIAAPLLGICGDKYGRKSTLFLVTLFIGYYGLLTSLSPSYYWLLFLRGLVGCGMGGSPQGTSLLSEYIPRTHRAKLLILAQVFWCTGVLFEILLACLVIPNYGWRWLLVASAFPSIFTSLGLLTIPESARYLLAAGHREKAIHILKEGARINKANLPKGQLVVTKEVDRGHFSNLFTNEYKRATPQLWFLWFNMAFFYYGMVLASTEILRKYNDTSDEHTKCHCRFLKTEDYITMLISTLGEFACLPLNWLFIDWLGRRKNAGILMLLASILVLLLQIEMSRTLFTVVLFGVRGLSSAFGNLLYIYSSEIYPTTVRTLGMGTASAWARVGAMVTPFVAQVLLSHSVSAACWLYSAVCLLCSIDAFLMPIETKERALPQSVTSELEMRPLTLNEDDTAAESE